LVSDDGKKVSAFPHEFHVLTNTIATPMPLFQKAAPSQAEKLAKLVYTPPAFLTDETVMAVSYQSFEHANPQIKFDIGSHSHLFPSVSFRGVLLDPKFHINAESAFQVSGVMLQTF